MGEGTHPEPDGPSPHSRTPVHRRALATAVDDVLARLDAFAAGRGRATGGDPGTPPAAPATPRIGEDGLPLPAGRAALDIVVGCFGLSAFERDVLVLTAAMEVQPRAAARCAAAAGDLAGGFPTFALALAALREPHWGALTPMAPLRRWRLIELDEREPLTTTPLRIDERVLHFLTGLPYLDPRLHGLLDRVPAAADLPSSQQAVAEAMATAWSSTRERPHVELVGADPQTRAEIAAAAAHHLGLQLYQVREAELPADAAERDGLARLWERESVLLPAALLIDGDDADRGGSPVVEALVTRLDGPVVLSLTDARPHPGRRRRLVVPDLGPAEQLDVWAAHLGGLCPDRDELAQVIAQFHLPAHAIRTAAAQVSAAQVSAADVTAGDAAPTEPTTPDAGEGITRTGGAAGANPGGTTRTSVPQRIWAAGLGQSRMVLDELGRRIEPTARPEDLVLPAAQLGVLDEIAAHVRQRARVYDDWGFARAGARGLGVSALFAGASGTGKTLAAEVVAGRLGLDLFVIDLSQVVDKYIGETEKNLRRVFDAAERGGAVLLFDEADALFGKRSEVRDSHDRYANLEVSYLLMRMEAYRGLAVLTTNLKKAMDQAFLRRLRFVVDFPVPGPAERAEIWRRVIPPAAPVQELDHQRLAQLTVPGGSIRNIALSAAVLAAEASRPIGMDHLLAATRSEYLKLDRALTPSEVAGWV